MSGPIVPPLTVSDEADGGSVSGRPITTIEVTSGTLTVSGRTATLDTSGSGGSPATPKDAIQFNSDPAGTFTSDTFFKMSVIGGDATTAIQAGNMILGGNKIAANTANQSVSVICDGTGEIFLQSESDGGGTFTDSVVNIMCNTNTDESQLKFRDGTNVNNGTITLDGSGHMVLNNNVAAKDIDLKVLTTGQVEVANQTTDTVSVLSIMGNGTGDARLDMQNASKRVWVVCDENKKLKIQGGSGGNTFIIDVSGAATGITFPDGSTQTTAASGGASTYGFVTIDPTIPTDGGTKTYSQSVPGAAPYWGNDTAGTGGYAWDEPFFWPFIASHTGDVDSISIDVSTSKAATEWYVGIYDVDSDGIPDNLLGKAVMDMSSTGVVTQSTLSATISLTKGEAYFWSYVLKTGDSAATTWRLASPPPLGISSDSSGPADIGNCFYYDGASNDLPAAPTAADFEMKSRTDPTMGAIAW